MAIQTYFRIVARGRSGVAALRSSAGRFHDDSSKPTSYVAPDLMTAWKEVTAALGVARANPAAFRALEVTVDEPEFERLSRAEEEALMRDPAPLECKMLAEDLRARGVEGLFYPSMRDSGGECLVLFLENLQDRVHVSQLAEEDWEEFVDST